MTDNKNDNRRQLDDFFDDSPTDELPIPVLPDSTLEGDDTANLLVIDTECPTGTDIPALEPDAAVTGTDTEQRNSAFSRLEAEIQVLRDDNSQGATAFEELEGQLQTISAERDELQLRLDQVRTETDERQKAAEGVEQRTETLERLNAEHRAEVATLAGYIDGRKAEWKTVHDELRKHRETIAALELSLSSAGTSLARKEEEKEALSTKLVSLQTLLRKKDQNVQNQADANAASIQKPDQQAYRSVTGLMVATNGDRVMKYPLYKKVITIGRSHHSDIQIRTEYVSREHARILTDDLGTFIEDLGSRNGIQVNAMHIEKRRLKHGDHVAIGEVLFKFVDLLDEESGEDKT